MRPQVAALYEAEFGVTTFIMTTSGLQHSIHRPRMSVPKGPALAPVGGALARSFTFEGVQSRIIAPLRASRTTRALQAWVAAILASTSRYSHHGPKTELTLEISAQCLRGAYVSNSARFPVTK